MNFSIYKHLNTELPIRTQVVDNIHYTIVPMVMMTVGVHSGSGGPILYTEAELKEFYPAWNGQPITMQHPEQDGIPVSANSPEFLETKVVGKVFNTYFEGDKLKAEAWLQTNKCAEIIAYLKSGRALDVSTGLFSNDIRSPGEYNGEKYDVIATEIRPDHLALLPGGTGACSWKDGCGIRANERGNMTKKKKEGLEEKDNLLFNYLEDPNFVINDMDYSRLMDAMVSKINSLDVQGEKYCYMRALFNEYVIYKAEWREGPSKLYKRNYTVSNGEVQFTSDPIEVVENVTYDIISNKEEKVTKKKEEVCCLEEVKAFVANENNLYKDEDVEWMSALPENQFKAIVNATQDVKTEIVEKEVIVEKEAKTMEELLANASPELKESIQYGQKVLKERKELLINSIKTNKDNKFSDEDLQKFDIDFLEKLEGSISINNTSFVGSVGGVMPKVNSEYVEPPLEDVYNKKDNK